jgi:signal transduction histidine kinase
MENRDLEPLLGHLCSAVGHHVINALSTLVSQGEILRTLTGPSQLGSAEVPERVDMIIRAAMEASAMTRRLIELSHDLTAIDADRPGSPVEEIHFHEWLSRFFEDAETSPGPLVTCILDLAPVPPFRGRSAPLRTMLKLLVENAVDALPDGKGSLTIASFTAPRNWLVVEIRDSGCGMTPDLIERAIEPFFTTKPGHLGVGLTIARGIWRRHRGTLTLESQSGTGTTIRLSAPSIAGS